MSLYNNIFDAHAHYDDKWFDDDRFELLENIHTKGVNVFQKFKTVIVKPFVIIMCVCIENVVVK